MKTVLITGLIGSGKSEVRRALEKRGYPVYDCDSRCKALYEEVSGLKSRIECALGMPFGELPSVFGDPKKLAMLEDIVFPLLLEDILKWRREAGDGVVFIESATAASKPFFRGIYDEVWLVEAPAELRHSRNGKAAQREGLQDFSGVPVARRIFNDSTLESLQEQINSIEI